MRNAATGIAVDDSGNSFVTGFFWNEVTFGQGENILTLIGSRFQDIFLAKYDSNGGPVWAKSALGSSYGINAPYDIAIDYFGNSYITGTFYDTISFGVQSVNEIYVSSSGDREIFIAKYDNIGNINWAKSAGGIHNDLPNGIAVDAFGNIYATGIFFYEATFGAGETNETTLVGPDDYEIFVAKYSSGAIPDIDKDCDVDGLDIAAYILDDEGLSLLNFAENFGKVNCQ